MFLIYFHYLPYQTGDEDRDIEALTTLGIKDLNPIEIAVYPNPAQDKIYFSLEDGTYKTVSLRVYDLMGNVIYEVNDHKVGSSQLVWKIPSQVANGNYYYSMNIDGNMASGPVTIMR